MWNGFRRILLNTLTAKNCQELVREAETFLASRNADLEIRAQKQIRRPVNQREDMETSTLKYWATYYFSVCSSGQVVHHLILLKQRELVRLGRIMHVRVGLMNTKLSLIQQILTHLYKDKATEVYAQALYKISLPA